MAKVRLSVASRALWRRASSVLAPAARALRGHILVRCIPARQVLRTAAGTAPLWPGAAADGGLEQPGSSLKPDMGTQGGGGVRFARLLLLLLLLLGSHGADAGLRDLGCAKNLDLEPK